MAVSREEKWYITHNSKSDLPLGGRNFPNAGGSGQRQFRRPQRNNRPHRRFPNRPSIFQQQPRPRPQQQTLRDTFDYQDDVPEFLQNKEEDVEYYDEEINFNVGNEPDTFEK